MKECKVDFSTISHYHSTYRSVRFYVLSSLSVTFNHYSPELHLATSLEIDLFPPYSAGCSSSTIPWFEKYSLLYSHWICQINLFNDNDDDTSLLPFPVLSISSVSLFCCWWVLASTSFNHRWSINIFFLSRHLALVALAGITTINCFSYFSASTFLYTMFWYIDASRPGF